MKKILSVFVFVIVILGLGCSGKERAVKGYIKALVPELEKAMATNGFETKVAVIKRGKVYDARVDFEGMVADNEKWQKASHDEKLAWFARVCAENMGFSLSGLEESGFMAFDSLYIGYAGQVWTVSIEYAGYISSHALSRSKSEKQLEKELMEKLVRVE